MSRLPLLDVDALEMENLDLALGKNTVAEFRDVGIKLQVCTSLSWSLRPTLTMLPSTGARKVA
jgi:autophagy-related protein 2